MIRVNVMYPKKEDGKFNYEYYLDKHVPMVKNNLGASLKRFEVYQGISGAGGNPEPFVTIASLLFENVDEFRTAFEPHAQEIMADLSNFTNINPTVQIEKQILA